MNEFSDYTWTEEDKASVLLANVLGCVDYVRFRADRLPPDAIKEKLDDAAKLITDFMKEIHDRNGA